MVTSARIFWLVPYFSVILGKLSSPVANLKLKQTLYFRNGTISTGGVNLKDIDLKWWRSQIGLVQQEPFLFNDTILKNVQYGLIGTEWEHADEETKRELVEAACKEAFADEFITRLPEVSYMFYISTSAV
jgi:ABC-type multidrug transport system fused ATPase/permease subunit